MTAPRELPTAWRERAELLRRYGAREAADTMTSLAGELETALRATDHEALTLAQASAESGFSPDHIRHQIASGVIPNSGRKGAPRVRRKDLPAKAGATRTTEYDPQADASAVRQAARFRSV